MVGLVGLLALDQSDIQTVGATEISKSPDNLKARLKSLDFEWSKTRWHPTIQ